MAAAELCAYEVFNGGTELDNIDVDDKVKGYNLRGRNYTVSEDGLCPRCGNSNKLYVILDKLFPMGDMPEILHNLIAKGRAILWSSQEKEGFRDPPTFLCRGFCPPDPLGAGFNVNWDNVSLDQILEALDRPMKATIPPSSPQTSSVQDEDSMEEISAEKSWVVLDDFDDERSDVEKNTSLTSITQSSSDKEGEEETEEDDDDLELDEEELIKQMLAKEQQKLTQDDSSEPADTENSVEQNSFTSSTDSTTTMTSTATAAAAAEASTTSSSSEAKTQYPVSTNGQCPYCQSTDVKYIIVVSDTTKDTELPHSLQELLKQKLAFKMAKGTSEPPSFQCQKCQYGFNLDWCKTNLEKIFGLPTSVSSSYTTTTTATNKPTSPLYTRPPAPYMPPAPYTPYAAPAVPPPRYPPPVALPPVVPPLPYHPYAPAYPGYYGYYPLAPIPQLPVPYPGYLPPGMPPPGVPPLGYPPPGVPPIPPHSVPPPNPWGAVPYAHHMYQAHPHYPPPRPRGYHPLPPRPRPPPGQYLRPPRPRPPRPWYQPPAQPASVATVPTQEEATAEPDAEGEKSKVAAARFEVLLNQIDQAKARVRHEKELMKEFQKEVGGNAASTSQPSGGDEEPNALTDEGQKSADYEEKPPGDDSQAADGGLYLGFGSDIPMVESSVSPVEKNEPDVSADAATEKHSVSLQHGVPRDTSEDLADVATSPARDATQANVHSDVDTSSAVVETEDDSQTFSSDYVPSSSEPCAEDASSIEALPKPGRRPGRAKKRGAPPAASRQTRRSRRSAPATPTEEDTDSTAAEEEALPEVGRLRKSRRTRSLEKKEEGESVEKVFDGEKEEPETVGSDVEMEGSSDVLSQSSIFIQTESDSRTLLSSSAQSPRESELEDMHPAVLNQSTSEADTVSEAVSNMTPRQRGRKTRGRKRKQESPAKVTPDSEPSSRESRKVSAGNAAVEEQSEMDVDEIQAGSGEENVASAQHKEEAEGALTSPRTRRSRRTPASAVTQPDEDDQEPEAFTQPEEESVPLHNQTTEEHEETDTTVEEILPDPDKTQESLKKNSGPAGANKRTRKSLRSSAPVDEPRETDHSSEVTSVPDASEDDSDKRRSRMSEQDEHTPEVKDELPVSSESETVVADYKIPTRRIRKSVPLTDGSDTTATEESTKSRRTRKSAQLSQESETEDSTSVRRTRMSVELSQEPEKSESEENSSSQRTPKSIQLSSQDPESLQTEENTSGRRTRKSIQSSSQEPESSETEGISSRRRTRKSTQISQGGGTLTHKDEIPDSQELIVSMEKEKELDILPADDEAKSVRRTRKSQKSSVSTKREDVSGTDEDVLLSQGSDTSTAKEEAPSNEQATPRTRKSRKSSVETEDAAKVPIESSVAIASSEEGVSSRRTRSTIKSAPPVIETAEMSQASDNLTPEEETEEEPSSPQRKVPRKTDEEATETVPKRITRTRRKK